MLLDGTQSKQSLAGLDSDGGSSSRKVRSLDGDRQNDKKTSRNSQRQGAAKNKRSKKGAEKKQSQKQLGQSRSQKSLAKYDPPSCYNSSTCRDVRFRVITTKRVTNCVVRYCKCPKCGKTTKIVEPVA